MPANDRTPKPNKPQGEKQSEKVTDISDKSVDSEKDEQVKGGRMRLDMP